MVPIDCPYKAMGCQVRPMKQDINDHLQSSDHLSLLLHKAQSLETKVESLQRANDEMSKALLEQKQCPVAACDENNFNVLTF
jgi:hypothetical protein